MTFDELCRAVQQVTGEIGHAMPYELIQQTLGDELVREAQKQGARIRRRKKSRKPPASVSSGASDDLEHDMKQFSRDPFWEAGRLACRQIENLPYLAEALDWLRRHQPKAHWQLSEFWVERLRDLWESGKLREFQEALRVWVQLHVEVCATYGSREKKIGFETNDLPVAFGSTGRGGRNR